MKKKKKQKNCLKREKIYIRRKRKRKFRRKWFANEEADERKIKWMARKEKEEKRGDLKKK